MTTAYKILGQSLPTPNSWVTIYTVPASNSAVISTLSVCNTSNSINARYSLIAVKSGHNPPTTDATNSFIISGVTVNSNDTAFLTLGITLGANDSLSANVTSSSNGNVAFNVFGSEIY